MDRIFLIGFMGSGKSTLGKELAIGLNYTFIETDTWIERQEGRLISQIFSESGENYFRERESAFLLHLQMVNECVIATGGGMPCSQKNIDLMNQLGTTIWLDVEETVLYERLEKEKDHRPMLASSDDLKTSIHDLFESRMTFYKMANHMVKNPTIDQLLKIIVNLKS